MPPHGIEINEIGENEDSTVPVFFARRGERILHSVPVVTGVYSLLYPAAGERPAYPADWLDSLWPRARVGFFEGQASAFYNVSPIERDYFEMWYFDNLGAYKGAAHGDQDAVIRGHAAMERDMEAIEEQAERLRDLAGHEQQEQHQRPDPSELWTSGDYTEFNREQN